jgi:hypothetical protein
MTTMGEGAKGMVKGEAGRVKGIRYIQDIRINYAFPSL